MARNIGEDELHAVLSLKTIGALFCCWTLGFQICSLTLSVSKEGNIHSS